MAEWSCNFTTSAKGTEGGVASVTMPKAPDFEFSAQRCGRRGHKPVLIAGDNDLIVSHKLTAQKQRRKFHSPARQ